MINTKVLSDFNTLKELLNKKNFKLLDLDVEGGMITLDVTGADDPGAVAINAKSYLGLNGYLSFENPPKEVPPSVSICFKEEYKLTTSN